MLIGLLGALFLHSAFALPQEAFAQQQELTGRWPEDWAERYPKLFDNQHTEIVQLLAAYPQKYRDDLFFDSWKVKRLIDYYPKMRAEIAADPKLNPHLYPPDDSALPPELESIIAKSLSSPGDKAAYERRQELITTRWVTPERLANIHYFKSIWNPSSSWPDPNSETPAYRFRGDINGDGFLTPGDLALFRTQKSFDEFREAWLWLQSHFPVAELPPIDFDPEEEVSLDDKSSNREESDTIDDIDLVALVPHLDWLMQLVRTDPFAQDPYLQGQAPMRAWQLLQALLVNQESKITWQISGVTEKLHSELINFCAKNFGFLPEARLLPILDESPPLPGEVNSLLGSLDSYYLKVFANTPGPRRRSRFNRALEQQPSYLTLKTLYETQIAPAADEEKERWQRLAAAKDDRAAPMADLFLTTSLTRLANISAKNYTRYETQDAGNDAQLTHWISQGLWLRTPASLVFNRTNLVFAASSLPPVPFPVDAPDALTPDGVQQQTAPLFAKDLQPERQIEAFQHLIDFLADLLQTSAFTKKIIPGDEFLLWTSNFETQPQKINPIFRQRHFNINSPFALFYATSSYDYHNRLAHSVLDGPEEGAPAKPAFNLYIDWIAGYHQALSQAAKTHYRQSLIEKREESIPLNDQVISINQKLDDLARQHGLEGNPGIDNDASEDLGAAISRLQDRCYRLRTQLEKHLAAASASRDTNRVGVTEAVLTLVNDILANDLGEGEGFGLLDGFRDLLKEHYEWASQRDLSFRLYYSLIYGKEGLGGHADEKRQAIHRRLQIDDDLDSIEYFNAALNTMIFMSYFDLNLDGRVDQEDLSLLRGIIESVI